MSKLFLIVFVACIISVRADAQFPICTGSYLKDKNDDRDIQFEVTSGNELLKEFIRCGIESAHKNGWLDTGGIPFETVLKQLSNIKVTYVQKLPTELLPKDQAFRRSAIFRKLPPNQWEILIATPDFQAHYRGEQYLLLFHEVISTLDPEIDADFSVSIEYEFKMLQANNSEFRSMQISDLVLPTRNRRPSKAEGTISSGGGDSSQLWLKRQLRNFLFDFILGPLIQGKSNVNRSQLAATLSAISYCPMSLIPADQRGRFYQKVDSKGRPMLLVPQDFFRKYYQEYLQKLKDSKAAARESNMASVKEISVFLLSVGEPWSKICNPK